MRRFFYLSVVGIIALLSSCNKTKTPEELLCQEWHGDADFIYNSLSVDEKDFLSKESIVAHCDTAFIAFEADGTFINAGMVQEVGKAGTYTFKEKKIVLTFSDGKKEEWFVDNLEEASLLFSWDIGTGEMEKQRYVVKEKK